MGHKLEIKNRNIYLDDFKLEDVTDYELKSSAESDMAELTVKLLVKDSHLDPGKKVAAGTTTIKLDAEQFAEKVSSCLNADRGKSEETQVEIKICKRCENTRVSEEDKYCNMCGMNFEEPKVIYDMRPVVKGMLTVLVKHEILIDSLDRVLEQLKNAALTSTRIQEIWANDDHDGYDQL